MSAPPTETSYRYGARDQLPRRSIRGFDHVNRFWDPVRCMVTAKILPGEYYVTSADELISTVLGSCVSACIWDPQARVGGMNHFMVPAAAEPDHDAWALELPARYGIFAMELLINAILKHGGSRERLRVKITGGGRVVDIDTGIGERNVEFVRAYLANERLTLVGEHVGGTHARKAIFHPLSGRAEVLEIVEHRNDTVVRRERDYAAHLTSVPSPGDIELFEE